MNGVLVPWVIATTIMIFVAAYWIYTLEKRINKFRSDYETLTHVADALNQEPDHAMLVPLNRRLDDHTARLAAAESQIQRFGALFPHVVRGVGVVRYGAFEGVGGDLSFSIALVDSEGHGAVLTGIHTGTDIRTYGKPIEGWKSSYSLSADEQRALGEARRRIEAALPTAPDAVQAEGAQSDTV